MEHQGIQKDKLDLHILYAEDEENPRKDLTEKLSSRYAFVDSVANGQELIDKLMSPDAKYDCVITDNFMPMKSGFRALQEMRTTEKLKHIPVVVYTADKDFLGKEIEALGAICIGKPVKVDEIYEAIERMAGVK